MANKFLSKASLQGFGSCGATTLKSKFKFTMKVRTSSHFIHCDENVTYILCDDSIF